MGIFHVVMFAFKLSAQAADVQDVSNRFLELKNKCIHPDTKKPYIKTGTGGKEDSPEGKAGGLTHIFLIEFENQEDRKYYLEKDPVHLDFANCVGEYVSKVQVVDFTAGVF